MGKSIINWGGVTDSQLSGDSEHPLTNKAATEEFLRQQNLITQKELELRELIAQANTTINNVKAMRASTTAVGMTQISTAENVTDTNAYVLPATEKNASIDGSIMHYAVSVNNTLAGLNNTFNVHMNWATNIVATLRQEQANYVQMLRNELNQRLISNDTTIYQNGTLLEWVKNMPSNASYIEVQGTVFPDRPQFSNGGTEIAYLKFGCGVRCMVLAVPYIDAPAQLAFRTYWSGTWLGNWRYVTLTA